MEQRIALLDELEADFHTFQPYHPNARPRSRQLSANRSPSPNTDHNQLINNNASSSASGSPSRDNPKVQEQEELQEPQHLQSLNSWHQTTRALNESRPDLPASRIGFPSVQSVSVHNKHSHPSASRPNTQATGAVSRSSAEGNGLAALSVQMPTQSEKRPHTATTHTGEDNFVKVDMVSMCSQGWNLSHVSLTVYS
jgi:hypothetical protein